MEARILSFRRGRHTQTNNHFLLEIENVDKKSKATQYIGKRVVWTSPGKKKIYGKIADTHGNKGVLRAIFSRGLPGTAITDKVEILE